MNIREIESIEEAKKHFPIIQEVRTHLDIETYLETLVAAREQGYKMLGLFEDNHCLAIMGYRMIVDFVHGKHLYIDDLVVTSKRRGQGLGPVLLSHAEELAKEQNCLQVRLCTGIDSQRAKNFYEKNNWNLRAVAYKKKL